MSLFRHFTWYNSQYGETGRGLVNEVPTPEIPKYIQQKVLEKAKLENETEQAMMEKNKA
jgi:hypothetical protein